MKVPNAAEAIVAREKIENYLLSFTSIEGYTKAVFFSRFGFCIDLWQDFAEALCFHCQQYEVLERNETTHGIQYAVVGAINTPDGRNPRIRTIWQIDHGTVRPRFITARPDR